MNLVTPSYGHILGSRCAHLVLPHFMSSIGLGPHRCLKYLGELLDLLIAKSLRVVLIANPEVVLNAVRDDDENYTVCCCVCMNHS